MISPWSFTKIWNDSLERREPRKIEARDRIWASELGKSDLDVYLNLTGVEPTNLPNPRALRKFEAGNVWEWIVQLILIRAGIYKESQLRVESEVIGGLKVTGRLDHVAGGKLNEDAKQSIDALQLPEMFTRASEEIINHFKEKYPEGLEERILEIKSVSSFAFDKIEGTAMPLKGHDLQLYHYTRNQKKDGAIVYICRDDARIIEIFIPQFDQALEDRYQAKVARLAGYIANHEEPAKEPEILFDEDEGRFSKNFNIEYSSFLTRNYGFAEPMEYDEKVSPRIARWNRVLGRIKDGKDMTDDNKEALAEMYEAGFDVDFIKEKVTPTNTPNENE